MSAQLEADADVFRTQLHQAISEIVESRLGEALRADTAGHLQVLYEVLAQHAGIIDGYAAIMGVDRSLRLHTLRCQFRSGKALVLATHSQDCADCEGATALREELEQEQ